MASAGKPHTSFETTEPLSNRINQAWTSLTLCIRNTCRTSVPTNSTSAWTNLGSLDRVGARRRLNEEARTRSTSITSKAYANSLRNMESICNFGRTYFSKNRKTHPFFLPPHHRSFGATRRITHSLPRQKPSLHADFPTAWLRGPELGEASPDDGKMRKPTSSLRFKTPSNIKPKASS